MKEYVQETVELEKVVSGGYGLGRVSSGQIIFVKNTLPGEKVLLQYKKSTKDFVFGRVIEYLKTSPSRITPLCPLFGYCGGCQYQMLSYDDQISVKQEIVAESLLRIGKISPESLRPFVRSPLEFGYRNKGSFQVFHQGDIGFCKPGTTVPFSVPQCYLMEEAINKKILDLRSPENNTSIQRLKTLNIRSNVKGQTIDSSRKRDSFIDQVEHLGFLVDIDTFFQVNRSILPLWLEHIREQVLLHTQGEKNLLLDLFCGVGIIGQYLSPHFKKVVGIEVNKRLIENGQKVLIQNHISNMEFLDADASVYGNIYPFPDCIIVNPPRTGLSASFITSITQFPPQVIIYSSCNPDTFARDLSNLLTFGYTLDTVVPFDMFPQTAHAEIVTVLYKK